MNIRKPLTLLALAGAAVPAFAQVPDLVAAFDAGGRAMGMGGVTYATGSDTMSAYHNPAGLGFIDRSTLGINFRNMPESRTRVAGDIGPAGTQRLQTDGETGPTGLGHAGIAIPLRGKNGSTNGTIALTLTAAGQIRDERRAAAGLTEGGLDASGFRQLLKLKTDFVNLSYGRATSDGSFAWGVGLAYATVRQVNNRTAPSGLTDFDSLATGLGAQAGVLFTPKDNPDLTFGLSYRTPIQLRTGGKTPLLYEQIPGRLQGGVALRRSGFRGERDFMVLGLEVQHFFAGKDSQFVERDPQTVLGMGLEYNYAFGNFRLPVRLGYSFVPAAGDFYGRRNVLTYGFGFRPNNGDWSIDLNFGRPSEGGNDSSIALTYRFK